MCGIGLLASFPTFENSQNQGLHGDFNHRLSQSLARRGPDVPFGQLNFTPAYASNVEVAPEKRWSLTLHASVLHMRGERPVGQPLSFPIPASSNGDEKALNCALCWNGECYTYKKIVGGASEFKNDRSRHGDMVEFISTTTSDTMLITELIREAIATSQNSGLGEHEAISEAMSRIHGEFSFILLVPSAFSACIYYGRDFLGRRSLLVNKSLRGVVALSSVAMGTLDKGHIPNSSNWEEIPPGIVYRLDPCTGIETSLLVARVVNMDVLAIPHDSALQTSGIEVAAEILRNLLDRAVKRRVMRAPLPKSQSTSDASVAVLFSGGIDSVVLAALCNRHVPSEQPIDLINVSFHTDSDLGRKTTSPDRLAAILSFSEISERFPERRWRLIAVDVPYLEVLEQESHILQLIAPLDSTMDFNIATAFWFAGRGEGRVLDMNEIDEASKGIDDKAVACNETVSTRQQEPLLRFSTGHTANVSKGSSKTLPSCISDNCTRLASQSCVFQACKVCCGKFQGPVSSYLGRRAMLCTAHNQIDDQQTKNIKSNAGAKNTTAERQLPSSFSASNAQVSNTHKIITSQAKILLSGVGADEQMAGYGRHRTTYQRGGYEALRMELQMEFNRLWTRNLGRDDRCLSDHGKEGRYPYLDEDVVAYLDALPLELKCDMTRPLGEGDKLLLRKVAQMIGVMECSVLQKRAIQFGSRIAKVSDRSRFGSGRQAAGHKKIVADKAPRKSIG
ncbi:hypothetical protein ACHAW5_003195 [Stephanodiscus triporus]|uniref:Glutamine amidotransferase type-2 domain-containing protein n=1 Tax=Stephanodiscus triporus TaxID=2934178 RepID=A0ABD3MNS2_9STRA